MAALRPRLQLPKQRTRSTLTSTASPRASVAALASAIPLRGESMGSVDVRQVMQTNTVVRSAAEFVVTRVAPLAEAPRPAREKKMAGFLACGSLRLAAFPRR